MGSSSNESNSLIVNMKYLLSQLLFSPPWLMPPPRLKLRLKPQLMPTMATTAVDTDMVLDTVDTTVDTMVDTPTADTELTDTTSVRPKLMPNLNSLLPMLPLPMLMLPIIMPSPLLPLSNA